MIKPSFKPGGISFSLVGVKKSRKELTTSYFYAINTVRTLNK